MLPRNPTIRRVADPVAEPFTTDELKSQLRVTHDAENDLIIRKGKAAREYVEKVTGHITMTGSVVMVCDGFPGIVRQDQHTGGTQTPLDLMCAPVTAIGSIVYLDGDDAQQTFDAANYRLVSDSEPAFVQPKMVSAWPTITPRPGAVKITMTAGYANAAAVPQALKEAILLMLGHLYENREATISGTIIDTVPQGIRQFILNQRVAWYH